MHEFYLAKGYIDQKKVKHLFVDIEKLLVCGVEQGLNIKTPCKC